MYVIFVHNLFQRTLLTFFGGLGANMGSPPTLLNLTTTKNLAWKRILCTRMEKNVTENFSEMTENFSEIFFK